ncbi:hypothetical protein BsWGS_24751 [Bradybaena similaris]
MNDRITRLM